MERNVVDFFRVVGLVVDWFAMFSFADAELACDGVVCIEDAMEELESVST